MAISRTFYMYKVDMRLWQFQRAVVIIQMSFLAKSIKTHLLSLPHPRHLGQTQYR